MTGLPGDLLRVLTVDDSATFRAVLESVLKGIPEVILADTAPNGRLALSKLARGAIDFVILDLEMPELDGLATLQEIRTRHPEIGVVMLSGVSHKAAELTLRALELGAIDFLTKGGEGSVQDNQQYLTRHLTMVMRCFVTQRTVRQFRERAVQSESELRAAQPYPAKVPQGNRRSSTEPQANPRPVSSCAPARERPSLVLARYGSPDVLVIGCSTGGPQALTEVIPALPQDIGVPVLVVQHMPPVFTTTLAQTLDRQSKLTVVEAQEGQPVESGTVYIAPGGHHMVVRKVRVEGSFPLIQIGLNDNPPENSCRPAVDVLFRSAATVYGDRVLAVVMTGMGEDGARGVKALKQRGCYCITQDAQSCVVYGMPRAVEQAGMSDESIPLKDMAVRIASLLRHR